MIRNLIVPALAAALLGGCVTGYDYRGGNGDYYYGQPSVEYQDDGYYSPYGYGGYGYPGGWSGMFGYGIGYGGGYGPYGYGYPYGYPYGYGYPYNPRPPVIVVRPDPRPGTHPRPHRDDRDDNDRDDNDRAVRPGPLPSSPPDYRRPLEPSARRTSEPMPQLQPSAPERFPTPQRIQREPQRSPSSEPAREFRRDRDESLKPHH